MELRTRRLLLVACPLEVAEALERDRSHAASLIGAALPDGWPDPELLGLLPTYAAQLRADASTLGFGVWIVIERARGVILGSAGFVGPPKEGEVELGFGIHPAYRNSGYATEAARTVVEWALAQPTVCQVVAECERTNAASIRLLQKITMHRSGERASLLTWSLPRSPRTW